MNNLKGKHIILGICGGIAAYKSVILLRRFVKAGAEVQVIITPAGKEFIQPVTLSALSGKPVISEFFTANSGTWNSHVDLGLWADAMVIAPATASTIAKMANGVADNMLVTTYLSAKEQVFVAPSMDLDMFAHPTTTRNLQTLLQDGVKIIEPTSGELASHLIGKGRMEEPERIAEVINDYFGSTEYINSCGCLHSDKCVVSEYTYNDGANHLDLKGEKILITAGPTYEKIDPVRFIGNHSSGKMGFALAQQCAEAGAEVVLVTGPVSLSIDHERVKRIDVTSAKEMLAACEREFDGITSAIFCAAVSDYAPAESSDSKIKRENRETMTIELVRNPDIAATLSAKKGDRIMVGFALETDNEEVNALGKIKRKNLDWIVLNSLRDSNAGFRKDTNKVSVYAADGRCFPFDAKPKSEVAKDIITTIFSNPI